MSKNRPQEAESTAEERSGKTAEEESGEKEVLADAELDQVAGGTSNVLKTREDATKAVINNLR